MFSMIKNGSRHLYRPWFRVAGAGARRVRPNPANRYPAYAEPGTYGYSPNANVPVRMRPARRQHSNPRRRDCTGPRCRRGPADRRTGSRSTTMITRLRPTRAAASKLRARPPAIRPVPPSHDRRRARAAECPLGGSHLQPPT